MFYPVFDMEAVKTNLEAATLTPAIDWLHAQLDAYLAQDGKVSGQDASDCPAPAMLKELSGQLGLSPFEAKVVLLCVGPECDPSLAQRYAEVQAHPDCVYPTFGLAGALFGPVPREAMADDGPLRRWRVVTVDGSRQRPLLVSPLQIDERIVNYLLGINRLDKRLGPYVLPMIDSQGVGKDGRGSLPMLSASQQELVDRTVARLARIDTGSRWPVLQLVGSDALSKELVARQLARQLDGVLYRLDAQSLPVDPGALEEFSRLWHRESLLLPLVLFVDTDELDRDGPGEGFQRLRAFLARSGGIFFISAYDVWPGLGDASHVLDIRKPTQVEQLDAWQALLPDGLPGVSANMATQFNFNLTTIGDIMRAVTVESYTTNGVNDHAHRHIDSHTGGEGEAANNTLAARIRQASLAQARPRMDMLAQRIIPVATWDDIVLPQSQAALLRHIAEQVNHRDTVYEGWGFRRRNNRGLGLIVLFAGESGTGKTMAAEILANHLKLNLYRIDLSAVVSKYIGETEKNLRKLFDAAEEGGALLFFDEADALFGKRSEVKDSHDRYANIEVNYLLQRLEAYQGLAILATNLKSGMDDAFTRRLRFSVTFPKPDEHHREMIWRKAFPPETPLAELDYTYLAKTFKIAGGSIYNAALNAAFMAAAAQDAVAMPHVLTALRFELAKEDRLLNENDFAWSGAGPRRM